MPREQQLAIRRAEAKALRLGLLARWHREYTAGLANGLEQTKWDYRVVCAIHRQEGLL